MGYFGDANFGDYGTPGYGVVDNAGATDPYLNSLYSFGDQGTYGNPGYGVDLSSAGGDFGQGDPGNTGLSMGDLGGLVKGGLSGIGRILQGILPGLLGAAQAAQMGLDRRPIGGNANTATGGTKPLDLDTTAGAVKISPIDNYVKLLQGLR